MNDIEKAAKAIYGKFLYDGNRPSKPRWVEGGNSVKQDEARVFAKAAIEAHKEALKEAGMVIVPRDPTDEMVKAAVLFKSIKGLWHSMIKAVDDE